MKKLLCLFLMVNLFACIYANSEDQNNYLRVETSIRDLDSRLEDSTLKSELRNNYNKVLYLYFTDEIVSESDIEVIKNCQIYNPYVLDFSGIKKFGGKIFKLEYCNYLQEIHFPNSDKEYAISLHHCGDLKKVYVPKLFTHSGNFSDNSNLEEYITEEGSKLDQIYDKAFSGCSNLKKVVLPENKNISIGKNAFYYCKELKDFDFSNIGWVAEEAFKNSGLEKIIAGPETCVSLNALESCENLREVDFSKNLKQTIMPAFPHAAKLERIALSKNITQFSYNSESPVFSKLELNENPNFINEKGVVYNKDKTELLLVLPEYSSEVYTFPASVTKAENAAFATNNKVRVIKNAIESDKGEHHIDYYVSHVYNFMTNVEEVYFNNSVKNIYSSAFEDSAKLKKIVCPDTLEKIYRRAFRNCTSLTELEIPDTVTFVGDWTFYGCSSIKKIIIPKACTYTPSFQKCTSLEEVVIPEGVIQIAYHSFEGCTSLKSINLPSTIHYLSAGAFKGCTGLKELNLPDGVKKIEAEVFDGCTNLTRLNLPWTLEETHQDFSKIGKLNTVYYDGSAEQFLHINKNSHSEENNPITVVCSNGRFNISTITEEVKNNAVYQNKNLPKTAQKSFNELLNIANREYENRNFLKALYYYLSAKYKEPYNEISDSQKYKQIRVALSKGYPGFETENNEEAASGWEKIYSQADEIFLDDFQYNFVIPDRVEVERKQDFSQNPPQVYIDKYRSGAWGTIYSLLIDGMKSDNYEKLYARFNLQGSKFFESRYSIDDVNYSILAGGNQSLNSLYNHPEDYRMLVNSINISLLNSKGLKEYYSISGSSVPVYKDSETKQFEYSKIAYIDSYANQVEKEVQTRNNIETKNYKDIFPDFEYAKGEVSSTQKIGYNIAFKTRPSLYVLPVTKELFNSFISHEYKPNDSEDVLFATDYYFAKYCKSLFTTAKYDSKFFKTYGAHYDSPKADKYDVKSYLYENYLKNNKDVLFCVYFTQEDYEKQNINHDRVYAEKITKLIKGGSVKAIGENGYLGPYSFVFDHKKIQKKLKKYQPVVEVPDFYVLEKEYLPRDFKGISKNVPLLYAYLAVYNIMSENMGYSPCYAINGSYNPKDWPYMLADDEYEPNKYNEAANYYNNVEIYWNPEADGFRLPTVNEFIYLLTIDYPVSDSYKYYYWGKLNTLKIKNNGREALFATETLFDFTMSNLCFNSDGSGFYSITMNKEIPSYEWDNQSILLYSFRPVDFPEAFFVRSTPQAIEFYKSLKNKKTKK